MNTLSLSLKNKMIGYWFIMVILFWFNNVCFVSAENKNNIENEKQKENRDIRVFLEWAFLNGVETDSIFWPVSVCFIFKNTKSN